MKIVTALTLLFVSSITYALQTASRCASNAAHYLARQNYDDKLYHEYYDKKSGERFINENGQLKWNPEYPGLVSSKKVGSTTEIKYYDRHTYSYIQSKIHVSDPPEQIQFKYVNGAVNSFEITGNNLKKVVTLNNDCGVEQEVATKPDGKTIYYDRKLCENFMETLAAHGGSHLLQKCEDALRDLETVTKKRMAELPNGYSLGANLNPSNEFVSMTTTISDCADQLESDHMAKASLGDEAIAGLRGAARFSKPWFDLILAKPVSSGQVKPSSVKK